MWRRVNLHKKKKLLKNELSNISLLFINLFAPTSRLSIVPQKLFSQQNSNTEHLNAEFKALLTSAFTYLWHVYEENYTQANMAQKSQVKTIWSKNPCALFY